MKRQILLAGWWLVGACGARASTSTSTSTSASAGASTSTSTSTGMELPWIDDEIDRAMSEAKASNRPLFVDAWALWCHTCLSMRAYVFRDPSLAPLRDRFVWLALDTEKPGSAAFLEQYPIDVYPTFFVLDPADGSVAGRWLGSMSIAQLRSFLEEGERTVQLAHAGRIPAGDPLALLRDGDRQSLAGEHTEAARLYARALAAAPPDWPRRAEALTGEMRALRKSGDLGACVDLALAQLDRTGNGPSAGDFVIYGLDCADGLPAGDARVTRLRKSGHDRLVALAQDASAPLAADDRGDLWGNVADLREKLGDPEGRKDAFRARLGVLDAAAARAPDAESAETFDWARAESLLALGRGADAVRLLEESERRLPQDYNPPARLARVYYELGKYDDGLAAVDRALARAYGPRKSNFYALKADLLEKQGKRDQARRVVEEQLAYLRALPQKRPALEAAAQKRLEGLR